MAAARLDDVRCVGGEGGREGGREGLDGHGRRSSLPLVVQLPLHHIIYGVCFHSIFYGVWCTDASSLFSLPPCAGASTPLPPPPPFLPPPSPPRLSSWPIVSSTPCTSPIPHRSASSCSMRGERKACGATQLLCMYVLVVKEGWREDGGREGGREGGGGFSCFRSTDPLLAPFTLPLFSTTTPLSTPPIPRRELSLAPTPTGTTTAFSNSIAERPTCQPTSWTSCFCQSSFLPFLPPSLPSSFPLPFLPLFLPPFGCVYVACTSSHSTASSVSLTHPPLLPSLPPFPRRRMRRLALSRMLVAYGPGTLPLLFLSHELGFETEAECRHFVVEKEGWVVGRRGGGGGWGGYI